MSPLSSLSRAGASPAWRELMRIRARCAQPRVRARARVRAGGKRGVSRSDFLPNFPLPGAHVGAKCSRQAKSWQGIAAVPRSAIERPSDIPRFATCEHIGFRESRVLRETSLANSPASRRHLGTAAILCQRMATCLHCNASRLTFKVTRAHQRHVPLRQSACAQVGLEGT